MISSPTLAWDGTDVDSGAYRDVTVEDISRSGSNVEIEVYDSENGEYRTFEMDDD